VKNTPKVIVTNYSLGSAEVGQGIEREVVVDLDMRSPEDLDWNVSQEENVIAITCRMRNAWSWPSYLFTSRPKANIHVLVPHKADVEIENRAGRIAIIGIKGAISAESSAGSIGAQDCEGSIKIRTRAGSISLRNVKGTVTAYSSAGSITFTGTLLKAENWFKSNLGSIDATLGSDADLTIEASTNLGSIRCIPQLVDVRYERGRQVGRIGAGTGKLFVETNLGSITIHS
jgi:DUF4097 and DUF4098 domain-containing protein YvlB